MKLLFVMRYELFVAVGVDEWILIFTAREAFAFFKERKERSMIGKKNIARQLFQNRKRLFEISRDSGITLFANELVVERRRASGEDDVVRSSPVGNFCGPGRVAFGVTRREVSS